MKEQTYVSKATGRFIRISPQKCRLVANLVRDRFVGEALTVLRFTEKRKGGSIVEKVLRSAIANAQTKAPNIDVDDLYISEIFVDDGPQMKRIRPAPQGRAYRIIKRMSHVHVFLNEKKGR
jgi:large subunit ribosomal protein L22